MADATVQAAARQTKALDAIARALALASSARRVLSYAEPEDGRIGFLMDFIMEGITNELNEAESLIAGNPAQEPAPPWPGTTVL